jgi:hypothetical protein
VIAAVWRKGLRDAGLILLDCVDSGAPGAEDKKEESDV